MKNRTNINAFFSLVRAGLWKKEVRLSQFKPIDYPTIMQLAEEQSVVGLVTAGLESVSDVKVPKDVVLQFIGSALQIEQRNKAMNDYVARLTALLRKEDINAFLVKGQGIAQCYDNPVWRTSGDIDLLVEDSQFDNAKLFLQSLSSVQYDELEDEKHIAYIIESWNVELHGNLPSCISNRIDKVISEVQEDTFHNNHVRVWINEGMDVYLPSADNDIIFIFTHILKHFFYGGIGLRQVCDWCRLLWTYRTNINRNLLESRLKQMGLMTEWKSFAAFAVNSLGMPQDVMPFYTEKSKWKKKGDKIASRILETGNFGHNKDNTSYSKHPFLIRKTLSLFIHTLDSLKNYIIFPSNSLNAWLNRVRFGLKEAVKV